MHRGIPIEVDCKILRMPLGDFVGEGEISPQLIDPMRDADESNVDLHLSSLA